MPELGQTIKLFVLSILIVIGLQVKVGGDTIENHITDWIHGSRAVAYVQDVASGGVIVIQDASRAAKGFIFDTINGKKNVESASRFNLRFKQEDNEQSENRTLRRAGAPEGDE